MACESPSHENRMECALRAGVLKSLLECTKDLWSSANFVFDANGLRVQAMDSSHISLASLALTPAAFSSYQCSEQVTLGIQFDALSTVLKSCGTDDSIRLEHALTSDHLTILRGEDRQWELKLLDSDQEDTTIPEQSYDISVSASAPELQRCLRDLKELGADTISVSVCERAISLSVDGQMGRGTASIKDGVDIEGEMDGKCKYSLKYLSAFTKGSSSLCPTVRLRMGKDTPLCVTYDIEGHGNLEFYLAPRIEDEDQ